MNMKLGILATHPIQYHAPLFRELARREGVDLTVYFCHRPTPAEQGEGFGVAFEWDLDLLSGYCHIFLKNVARHPTRGFWGYDTPEIADTIRQEKFDFFIVHGWNNKACWQAFRACRGSGTRLGVRSDSQLPQGHIGVDQKIKKIIKKLVYPLFIGRFDLCLPYGQRSAEYFRYFGAKWIAISPHFVDNDLFYKEASQYAPDRPALRRQWLIPEQASCFLFCGKFQAMKRPLDSLKALQILIQRERAPTAHLLMVGDGELREECEAFADRHNLPATFAGFLNQGEITKAYAAADCLLLPSDSETWGLVVNEAMACGLPVIVSDACGCVPDLIVEGETGYSSPCGDIEALAHRMRRLVTDREAWRCMSEGARRHISAFSVELAADTLMEAIRKLKSLENLGAVKPQGKILKIYRNDPPGTNIPMTSDLSPRKTRILAVFGNVAYMGQERANIFVLDLLQKSGKAECLLAVNDRGVQWYVQPHLEAAGLRFHKMRFCWNLKKTLNLRHWWLHVTDIIKGNFQFYQIWKEFKPDYIHCGNAFQIMTLLPVLSRIHTPVIFRLGDEPVQRFAVECWLWRRLAAKVDRVVCISRFILKSLLTVADVSAKARVIYNYPPERAPRSAPDPRIPAAAPDRFTVIYLGQIAEIKGVDLMVEAAIRFLERHPDSRFIIAGPAEPPQHQLLAQRLISQVATLRLGDRIIFTGTVEDVPTLIEQGQVHICPSVFAEPLSNVVPEAKIAHRPSIIFPSGGLPELVKHQVDGYICSEKTVSAILEALEYYHALPDWGGAQGEAAFRSLEVLGITREHFVNSWMEVYGLAHDASPVNQSAMRK